MGQPASPASSGVVASVLRALTKPLDEAKLPVPRDLEDTLLKNQNVGLHRDPDPLDLMQPYIGTPDQTAYIRDLRPGRERTGFTGDRYSVNAIERVVRQALQHGIDPDLALAVALQEGYLGHTRYTHPHIRTKPGLFVDKPPQPVIDAFVEAKGREGLQDEIHADEGMRHLQLGAAKAGGSLANQLRGWNGMGNPHLGEWRGMGISAYGKGQRWTPTTYGDTVVDVRDQVVRPSEDLQRIIVQILQRPHSMTIPPASVVALSPRLIPEMTLRTTQPDLLRR